MKIVVVDQFPVLRNGLIGFLEENFSGAFIIEQDNLDYFFDIAQPECVELVIIGLTQLYPVHVGGIIKKVKQVYSRAKIVLYDDKLEPDVVIASMKGGVDGYISKVTPVGELLEYVQDILQGNRRISKDIVSVILSAKYLSPVGDPASKKRTLTAHEYEIARYLSEGMKTNRIANMLDRKASTISTIKSTIFRKLEVDNVVKLRELIGAGQLYEMSRI